jgi:hypothetical protein
MAHPDPWKRGFDAGSVSQSDVWRRVFSLERFLAFLHGIVTPIWVPFDAFQVQAATDGDLHILADNITSVTLGGCNNKVVTWCSILHLICGRGRLRILRGAARLSTGHGEAGWKADSSSASVTVQVPNSANDPHVSRIFKFPFSPLRAIPSWQ